MNFWLSLVVLISIVVFLIVWWRRHSDDDTNVEVSKFDPNNIQAFVRKAMLKLISNSQGYNVSESEYENLRERQNILRKALRTCMQGDIQMKKYVKSRMSQLLETTYGINDKNIHHIIPFNRPDQLSVQDMFDILLYSLQKSHQYNALDYMIREYKLDEIKTLPDGSEGYMITPEDIKKVYLSESPNLSYKDKLNIVIQRIYQSYKGLGVVDELRDMNIDGMNAGTSGLPPNVYEKLNLIDYINQTSRYKVPRSYDAVWIYYKGKSINLSFLSFGNEKELKRVCQNIYTFGFPGQLNESVGYKINDMADGSRIVVVRPKLGENWAFFLRKFDDTLVDIKNQIKGNNAEHVIDFVYCVVRGKRGIAITGPMGAGKTSLLKAVCGFIDPLLNIRVLELAFELFLKKYYMFRNIFTFRESSSVSAQEALEMSKKTDGGVMVLGEIVSRALAKIALEIKQSVGDMLLFTHHGNSFQDLIEWFSDSVGDIKTAARLININIHLASNHHGRHLERITECVPLQEKEIQVPDIGPNADPNERIASSLETITQLLAQRERKTYSYHNIVEWRDGGFVFVHRPSQQMIDQMVKVMRVEDAQRFLTLLDNIEWEVESEGAA